MKAPACTPPRESDRQHCGSRRGFPERWLPWLLLAVAVGLFLWHANSSAFIQDDSYITYRYARNVARGHGPVFNHGERVEGYTNFLWMKLLASLAVIGLPFAVVIPLSQVIGIICGVGIIVIFYLLLRRYSRGPPLLLASAPLLLAANGAFVYWSVSGMESALFSLLLIAAAWFWLGENAEIRSPNADSQAEQARTGCQLPDPVPSSRTSSRGLVAASTLVALAALTRPEGALFFGLFCLHFVIRRLADWKWSPTTLQGCGICP